ncbi:hypothetical protein KGO95_03300 [Patescibacteria group bacterium]|nr:hypothetical protein [Patescibacteria group bacterium]
MKRSPRNILLAEFSVQVYANYVDWGGLDFFLWRLMHVKPEEGFLPASKKQKPPRRSSKR